MVTGVINTILVLFSFLVEQSALQRALERRRGLAGSTQECCRRQGVAVSSHLPGTFQRRSGLLPRVSSSSACSCSVRCWKPQSAGQPRTSNRKGTARRESNRNWIIIKRFILSLFSNQLIARRWSADWIIITCYEVLITFNCNCMHKVCLM